VAVSQLDKTAPAGNISINGGAPITGSTTITLSLNAIDAGSGMGAGAQMQFSFDGIAYSSAENYGTTKVTTLSGSDGLKTVYVKYKDAIDNWSGSSSSSIKYVMASKLLLEVMNPNPGQVVSDSDITIRITAQKVDSSTATGYLNRVGICNTDSSAITVPDYTFLAGDSGVKTLVVKLKTLGDQTITVTDKDWPGITNGTAKVNVFSVMIVTGTGGVMVGTDGTKITIPGGALSSGNWQIGMRVTPNPKTLTRSYMYKDTVTPISRDFGVIDMTQYPGP